MRYKPAIQTSLPDKPPWGLPITPSFLWVLLHVPKTSTSALQARLPTSPSGSDVTLEVPGHCWMLWLSLPSSGVSRPWQRLLPQLKSLLLLTPCLYFKTPNPKFQAKVRVSPPLLASPPRPAVTQDLALTLLIHFELLMVPDGVSNFLLIVAFACQKLHFIFIPGHTA